MHFLANINISYINKFSSLIISYIKFVVFITKINYPTGGPVNDKPDIVKYN